MLKIWYSPENIQSASFITVTYVSTLSSPSAIPAQKESTGLLGHVKTEGEWPRAPQVNPRVHLPQTDRMLFQQYTLGLSMCSSKTPFVTAVLSVVWVWQATSSLWVPFKAKRNLRTPMVTSLNLVGRKEAERPYIINDGLCSEDPLTPSFMIFRITKYFWAERFLLTQWLWFCQI
jgi:hypothetical protein